MLAEKWVYVIYCFSAVFSVKPHQRIRIEKILSFINKELSLQKTILLLSV